MTSRDEKATFRIRRIPENFEISPKNIHEKFAYLKIMQYFCNAFGKAK